MKFYPATELSTIQIKGVSNIPKIYSSDISVTCISNVKNRGEDNLLKGALTDLRVQNIAVFDKFRIFYFENVVANINNI